MVFTIWASPSLIGQTQVPAESNASPNPLLAEPSAIDPELRLRELAKMVPEDLLLASVLTPVVKTKEFPWQSYETLTPEKLRGMSLDDPLFRAACAQFFLRTGMRTDWMMALYNDLIRRGDSVTPLLLSLFGENPESAFRDELMGRLDTFPNLNPEPYLQAARNVVRQEGSSISMRTCYHIAWLFEKRGTEADLEVLKELQKHGGGLQQDIRRMAERLGLPYESEQRPKTGLPAIPQGVVRQQEDSSLYQLCAAATFLIAVGLWISFRNRAYGV